MCEDERDHPEPEPRDDPPRCEHDWHLYGHHTRLNGVRYKVWGCQTCGATREEECE